MADAALRPTPAPMTGGRLHIASEVAEDGANGVLLQSPSLQVTVAVGKGADLTSIRHRRTGIEFLWQASEARPVATSADDFAARSTASWNATYRGGWQTILPNFGPPCRHQGRDHHLHGEAARLPWSTKDLGDDRESCWIDVETMLQTVPLHVARSIELNGQILKVTEAVTNVGDAAIEAMWGHHPVLGPPFLSEQCLLETSAQLVEPDSGYDNPNNDLRDAPRARWPIVEGRSGPVDLSHMPAPGSTRSRVATLHDLGSDAWWAVTNKSLGLGFGLAWDGRTFAHATLWQESGGFTGPPWQGKAYALAIEPQTSYPGWGLADVAATTGTQLRFDAGQTRTARLVAVVYEGTPGIARIELDGKVLR